jgi:hypothetical protein
MVGVIRDIAAQPLTATMKSWIVAAPLGLLTFFIAGCGGRAPADKADDVGRHAETSAGFSFVPPKGWETRQVSGLKFKAFVGPAARGLAPSINVFDYPFKGPLDAYVKGNLATLQRGLKHFRLLRQDEFKTSQGLPSARLFIEHESEGGLVRQIFYIFDKGDMKFVVTCTVLADRGDKLDQTFEDSMKTFRFDTK